MYGFIKYSYTCLELRELLLALARLGEDTKNVEADSLGERSALANSDLVTLINTESRGDVGSKVLVALLVTVVLGNVVEVFTTDDDGSVHLGGDDSASQNLTSDGHNTGEGALVVNVVTVDSLSGGLETETNILVPTLGVLVDLSLGVLENVRLLKRTLVLDSCFDFNRRFIRQRRDTLESVGEIF